MTTDEKPKARPGFGGMTPERRREVAAKGGSSVDPAKRAFSKNRDLASAAGKLGGATSHGGGRKPKAP
jgi:general stress protein YciG